MIKPTSKKERKFPSPVSGTPIPDKLYFRIGDVAKLCGVEAYVLRFWETEFPQLRPNKSGTGQRLYRKRDVELALRIKQLLHHDGYTIAGARQVFSAENRESKASAQGEPSPRRSAGPTATSKTADQRLANVRGELREILGMLSSPVKQEKRGEKPRKHTRNEGPSERGLFDS